MLSIQTIHNRSLVTGIAVAAAAAAAAALAVITTSVFFHPFLEPTSSISSTRSLLVEATMESSPVTSSDKPSFSDTFPERRLVVDAMELQMLLFDSTVNEYYSEAKLRRRLSTNGFTLEYIDLEKPGATVMIVTSNMRYFKTPIVVFRGTGDEDDVFTDLLAKLVDTDFVNAPAGVQIHQGFHMAMFENKVVNDIEERVLKILGTKYKNVVVTGYSLGHSNGQVMATYLADKYPSLNVQMIGFASPIVGNMAFKLWSENLKNLSVWRYVYKNDIVPRLHIVHHLDLFGWEYKHAGHLVNIELDNSTKAYYRQSGDKELYYAGVPKTWYYPTYAFTWVDHLPTVYANRFSKQTAQLDELWPTGFEIEAMLSVD